MAAQEPGARDSRKNVDLVFEAGGIKGIALVGAVSTLEEAGFTPVNLAGSSAGAIITTLLAAGYTAAELKEVILSLNFKEFMDRAWEDQFLLFGSSLSILRHQGIYEGRVFLQWMNRMLDAKGVRTFRDLIIPGFADNPRYRWKAQVIASDTTQRRLLVLPRDAPTFGIEADDLSVALAVRMSMSIPIFFWPVRFHNPKTGKQHLIVDGAILSSFPVWLFDVDGEPEWPTFGLLLVEEDPRATLVGRMPDPEHSRTGIGAVVDFLKSLILTMYEAHDRLYLEQSDFARTITIPTLGVRTTEFGLSPERALRLFDAGRAAAQEFLRTWDFEAYKARFRRGQVKHSRRQEVLEQRQDEPT